MVEFLIICHFKAISKWLQVATDNVLLFDQNKERKTDMSAVEMCPKPENNCGSPVAHPQTYKMSGL